VRTDPAFPGFGVELERRIDRAQALDARTLLLDWKEAYLWAGMVGLPDLSPMPRHLLEPLYLEGMEAFATGPHWRERFVGSGPYRVEGWDPGVELLLRAHDNFVLGRPPIEQIRVKFVSDANTVLANLLAGTIDVVPAHFGFPGGQALEQGGWDGHVEYWSGNPRALAFQMRDWGNLQRAVLDVRVRRAALHAIDRRGIVEALFGGKARVAHFWLPPSDPAYAAADRAVTKYELDRGRAEGLLREAGWTRGPDNIARSASGEALQLPLLTTPGDVEQNEAATVVDNWKAVGATSELRVVSPRELNDGELRSKYPAVSYERRALTLENMSWTARQVSRPENRWSGSNRNGYVNPSLDDLWSRALGTIDTKEREILLVEALKVMTEDAVVTPTHLQVEVMAYAAGITGPSEPSAAGRAFLWNTWQWRWAA
jgi:peptide/nickel transport system substrate-binding protein